MPTEDAPRLRNHWWPRPGWRPGRIMLTWHLTFEHATELHQLVTDFQQTLAHLPGLNLVPVEWLHLTIQGVGYEDETPAEDAEAVIECVQERVAGLGPFELTFTRPRIYGEAIAFRPEPAEPLQQLLGLIREGIADARGPENVPTGPEQLRGFHPHLTIAYSNIDADARPYSAALATIQPEPVVIPISHVTLIRLDRQLGPYWLYRWSPDHRHAYLHR
jgi:2'-5' RNA ligase